MTDDIQLCEFSIHVTLKLLTFPTNSLLNKKLLTMAMSEFSIYKISSVRTLIIFKLVTSVGGGKEGGSLPLEFFPAGCVIFLNCWT